MSPEHPRTCFLSALNPKQRMKLSLSSPRLAVRRGAYLYLAGDEAESLYILQSGRIKISRVQCNGRESALGILDSGELFGLEGLRGFKSRDSCARALDESRVIAIDREKLQALVQEQPELSLLLIRILSEQLMDSQRVIERLLLKDVKARLASLLLDLALRCGIPAENGVRLGAHITHQDMANLIGSTRETTTAVLNQFKRSHLIQMQRREITLTAWEDLRQLAS